MTLGTDALNFLKVYNYRAFTPRPCDANGKEAPKEGQGEDADETWKVRSEMESVCGYTVTETEDGQHHLWPDIFDTSCVFYIDGSLEMRRAKVYPDHVSDDKYIRSARYLGRWFYSEVAKAFKNTSVRKVVLTLDEIGRRPEAKDAYTPSRKKTRFQIQNWVSVSGGKGLGPCNYEAANKKSGLFKTDPFCAETCSIRLDEALPYDINSIWAHEEARAELFRFVNFYGETMFREIPPGCKLVIDGGIPFETGICGCAVEISHEEKPAFGVEPVGDIRMSERTVRHVSASMAAKEDALERGLDASKGTPFGCATSVGEGEMKIFCRLMEKDPAPRPVVDPATCRLVPPPSIPIHIIKSVDGDVIVASLLQADSRINRTTNEDGEIEESWAKAIFIKRRDILGKEPVETTPLTNGSHEGAKKTPTTRTVYTTSYVDANFLRDDIVISAGSMGFERPVAFICALLMLGGNDYVESLPLIGFNFLSKGFLQHTEIGDLVETEGERSAANPETPVRYGVVVWKFFAYATRTYTSQKIKVVVDEDALNEELSEMTERANKGKEEDEAKVFVLPERLKEELTDELDAACISECPDFETFFWECTYLQFLHQVRKRGNKQRERLRSLSDMFRHIANLAFALTYYANAHIPNLVHVGGLEREKNQWGRDCSLYGFERDSNGFVQGSCNVDFSTHVFWGPKYRRATRPLKHPAPQQERCRSPLVDFVPYSLSKQAFVNPDEIGCGLDTLDSDD